MKIKMGAEKKRKKSARSKKKLSFHLRNQKTN